MRELPEQIFKNGECVYESPSVMEIRDVCRRELDTLWDEAKRLINPHRAHIDLSSRLHAMKNSLLESVDYMTHHHG